MAPKKRQTEIMAPDDAKDAKKPKTGNTEAVKIDGVNAKYFAILDDDVKTIFQAKDFKKVQD